MGLKVGKWWWTITLGFTIERELLLTDGVIKSPSGHLGAVLIDKRGHFPEALPDSPLMTEARKRRSWQCFVELLGAHGEGEMVLWGEMGQDMRDDEIGGKSCDIKM